MSMNKLNELFDMKSLINYYGQTTSLSNCGYILPDGTLLNYCNNTGLVEHYEVEKFYRGKKCDCGNGVDTTNPECENKKYCRYSIRNYFLFGGAVRCIPSDDGICNVAGLSFNKKVLNDYIEHYIFNNHKVYLEINKYMTKKCADEIFLHSIKNIDMEIHIDNYSPSIIRKIEGILNA
jgi:hypothetical protein